MNLLFNNLQMKEVSDILAEGAKKAIGIKGIVDVYSSEFIGSNTYNWMLEGEKYYRNDNNVYTDVRHKQAIDADGNIANNKLKNPFIKKLVDQKVAFLLGKPVTVDGENDEYVKLWSSLLNETFDRKFKSVGKEAVNKGIGWLHIYIDQNGKLGIKKMESQEIIPLWLDDEHTELEAIIRKYTVEVYEGTLLTTVQKYEYWDKTGVHYFVKNGGVLEEDIEAGGMRSHFYSENIIIEEVEGETIERTNFEGFGWGIVPFIPFKYNEEEIPLIKYLKDLVDDYNRQKSINSNNLEDLPNSIYVVKGFGGSTAAEVRKNIAKYRIIMIDEGVSSSNGSGGVDSVSIEIDTEAFKTHMSMSRKDIYEFGRGVDTQNVDIGSAASGIALKFLYSDLTLDSNMIEIEFQSSLHVLKKFFDIYLFNTTGKDYTEEKVKFIFNKDMPIDEESIIKSLKDSVGILSSETLVAQHPYTDDKLEEMKRKKVEQKETLSDLDYGFPTNQGGNDE